MSEFAEEYGEAASRSVFSAMPEKLRLAINRAVGAASFLRKLVMMSAFFCLLGSAGLAVFWMGDGIGGVMKIGLALCIAAGFLTVLLLGLAWLVLGRVVSIEGDLDALGDEAVALLKNEVAESPELDSEKISGKFAAFKFLLEFSAKVRAMGRTGEQLASTLGKAALLGNPIVHLCVLGLVLVGFALPFCGGLLLVLRVWWRARGG